MAVRVKKSMKRAKAGAPPKPPEQSGGKNLFKGTNILVMILVGLLILGLAGFGIGNFGGNVRDIGSVGEEKISVDSYIEALRIELLSRSEETGSVVTIEELIESGGDREVMQRLVRGAAFSNESRRLGLSASDSNVLEVIASDRAFQGIDGNFDRDVYDFAIERSGYSAAEYDALIRREIVQGIIQNAIISAIAVNRSYAGTLANFAREERDFTWAAIRSEDVDPPALDADAVRAHYDRFPEPYTAPETRNITYVSLTPDMLAPLIEVSDEAVEALYEAEIDDYVSEERRSVERIVMPSEDEAARAKERLDLGDLDFDGLLAERGVAPIAAELGEIIRADLSEAAADAVFGTAELGVVGPVESELGPALFRVSGIIYARNILIDDVREELEARVSEEEARDRILQDLEAIEDLLAGGATLEELADETDMQLGMIALTDETFDGIAEYAVFRDVAFEAETLDFPELAELPDGGLFALRVDEVEPATLRPFDEVMEKVEEDWLAHETKRRMIEMAELALTTISGGATFEEAGLTAQEESQLRRIDFVGGAPSTLLEDVFAMDVGAARIVEGDAVIAVARLDDVIAPDRTSDEFEAYAENIRDVTSFEIARDAFSLFGDSIERKAGISIDSNIVEAIHAFWQ